MKTQEIVQNSTQALTVISFDLKGYGVKQSYVVRSRFGLYVAEFGLCLVSTYARFYIYISVSITL